MQKRAAGACCTIDDLFRQDLKVLAVVGVFITQDADRAQPAMADTDDLIPFAQGTNGDRADRGIEPRHIPAAGENTDQAFPRAHATPLSFSSSMQKKNRRKRLDVQEASLRSRPERAQVAGETSNWTELASARGANPRLGRRGLRSLNSQRRTINLIS